jgi:ParB family chromosome partitioning protein
MASSSRRQPRSLASQLLASDDLGEISAEERAAAAEASFGAVPRALLLPIERLAPNPDNPRKVFEHLGDLAASIAERGVLQPLLVRRDHEHPGFYITVAGARRLLAARIVQGHDDAASRAQVINLPCVIMDQTDRDAFADALAENLARQDLSRAEVMGALDRLHKEYGWSARYIAKRTGRSVGDVAELLGIARDESVAVLVRDEIITPTTAGQIRRLPIELRPEAIQGVQAGRVKTVEDVRRIRRRAEASAAPTAARADHLEQTPQAAAPTVTIPRRVSDIGHPKAPHHAGDMLPALALDDEDRAGTPHVVDLETLAIITLFKARGTRVPRADVLQALRADLAILEP